MSKQTWLLMVKVATKKRPAQPARRRRKKPTHKLATRSVREDHYALLAAAGY